MIMINRSVVFFWLGGFAPPFFWGMIKNKDHQITHFRGDQTWCIFLNFGWICLPKNVLFGSAIQWFLKNWPPLLRKKHVAWDVVSLSDWNSPRQRKARRVRGPRLWEVPPSWKVMWWWYKDQWSGRMIWESLMFFCYFCCHGLMNSIFCDSPIRRRVCVLQSSLLGSIFIRDDHNDT